MTVVSLITAKREEQHSLISGMRRLLDYADEQRRDLTPVEARRYDSDLTSPCSTS
jgi:hypothetical protein